MSFSPFFSSFLKIFGEKIKFSINIIIPLYSPQKELAFNVYIFGFWQFYMSKNIDKRFWIKIGKNSWIIALTGDFNTKTTALRWPPRFFSTLRDLRTLKNGGELVPKKDPSRPISGPWETDYMASLEILHTDRSPRNKPNAVYRVSKFGLLWPSWRSVMKVCCDLRKIDVFGLFLVQLLTEILTKIVTQLVQDFTTFLLSYRSTKFGVKLPDTIS